MAPFVTIHGLRDGNVLVFQVPKTDLLVRHNTENLKTCVSHLDRRRPMLNLSSSTVRVRRAQMIRIMDLAAEALWNDRVTEYEWSPQYEMWRVRVECGETDLKPPKMDKRSSLAKMQSIVESYAESLVQDAVRDQAARVILRQFKKANLDPGYRLCRNRLLYEHTQLVSDM